MTKSNFLRGVGVGLAVGTAMGSMMPGKRKKKSTAAKAIRSLTEVMDNLSNALDL